MRILEVPLYSDVACTIKVKKLKILEIENKTESITVPARSYNGTRLNYEIGQFSNMFSAPKCLEYGEMSNYPSENNLAQTTMRNYFCNVLKNNVSLGASNVSASIDDGINIVKLFKPGDVLYVKNGARIECTNETVLKTEGAIINIYPRNGSTPYILYSPYKFRSLSSDLKYPSLDDYGQAYELAFDNPRTVIGYGLYVFLYVMSNDHNLNNNYRDCEAIYSTITAYDPSSPWGAATTSSYTRTGSGHSSTTTTGYNTQNYYSPDNRSGNLYRLFNFITNIDNYSDGEWKDYDPLAPQDNTYPGGGDDKNTYPDDENDPSGRGDFDNTNDSIDFPTLPTWDVQSTGFISLWRPTITQLTSLYAFLWDSDISTTLKKLFNEPMNAIFSLGILPVDPVIQGTRHLTIGHVDTEIDMESIQKQFVTFDFGSIDINEYYGAAWDYSPYTQASIFLPYIGIQPVDIDDIMNCTLTLRYNIDILTGTTIALLKCVRKGRDNLNAVMYEWQGNCVTQCPITAGNWSQIMASVIQLGAMTGLALSQPVVGAIGSAVGSSAAAEYAQGKNLVNPTMTTYGALNVLGSKVHVQRGGRIDMSAGAMSMQKAYVILNRPVSGIPRGWNKYAGYPSLKIKTLGSQKGFVSVGAIKLDGLKATADEITELDTILKAGVII